MIIDPEVKTITSMKDILGVPYVMPNFRVKLNKKQSRNILNTLNKYNFDL